MKQSSAEKKLDVELWSLVGGKQYHTRQMMRIKYRNLLKEKNKTLIEHLNRGSRAKLEDLD